MYGSKYTNLGKNTKTSKNILNKDREVMFLQLSTLCVNLNTCKIACLSYYPLQMWSSLNRGIKNHEK